MSSNKLIDALTLIAIGLAVAVVLLYLVGCDSDTDPERDRDPWENEDYETDTHPGWPDNTPGCGYGGDIDWSRYISCYCKDPCGHYRYHTTARVVHGIAACEDIGLWCCCELDL